MDNPFGELGLLARYDIDLAELHRRYVTASAATHPDRFSDPLEQADAAARAARINRAYQTLRDPETRAGALVEALGGPARGDDKSLPLDLLERMLDLREQLDDARAGRNQTALAGLRELATAERAARRLRVAELFAALDGTSPADRAGLLQQVRLELNALRYFQRMLESL